MSQPQAELFDLYRTGLKTATDLVKSSLESAERLQNQQLVAIRTALEQQSKSAAELSRVKTIDELIALQSRLAGAQFERAMTLWSDLFQAAGENQRAAIERMQEQMAQARNWMSETYAVTVATTSAGARQSAKAQQQAERRPEA
jgi:phasin family protein